jgi:hypothetical protein
MLDAGEEAGCLNLSDVSAALQDLELDEEELEALYQEIEERGITSPTIAAARARAASRPTSTETWRPRPPTRCSSS